MKVTTKVYQDNLNALLTGEYRVIANKGGTRSGKTYSLVSLLLSYAVVAKHSLTIDIVSESLPHLKRGAMNDMEDITTGEGMVEGVQYELNRSDHIYTFPNGAKVRFFSADDWGKVKGSKRDILFINECNRIPWEVYRQLAVRTTDTIFLDWNPDAEFWYEEQGINTRANTVEIHSTYLDNPYLSEVQIAEIESRVNEVISQHLPVTVEFVSRDNVPAGVDLGKLPADASDTLRIVRVGYYDTCACIGAHVENTSEIGMFRIISHSFENGTLRLRFKLQTKE